MGGSPISIAGTHVPGMSADPMSTPPSTSGTGQTSQAATIYAYSAPTYGTFHRASMALAARQQGGSVEATLAYWYGEMEGVFTSNFEAVVNLATQTFEEGACARVADIFSLITNILG